MPIIDNPQLYNLAKKEADKIFTKSSAYKSGFIIKSYKDMGGTYTDDNKPKNLKRWFKEEWKDIGNKDYPVYRPSKKISKTKTPLLPDEIDKKNLVEQIKLKQIIKGKKNLPPFKLRGGSIPSELEPFLNEYKNIKMSHSRQSKKDKDISKLMEKLYKISSREPQLDLLNLFEKHKKDVIQKRVNIDDYYNQYLDIEDSSLADSTKTRKINQLRKQIIEYNGDLKKFNRMIREYRATLPPKPKKNKPKVELSPYQKRYRQCKNYLNRQFKKDKFLDIKNDPDSIDYICDEFATKKEPPRLSVKYIESVINL
jgi:hypothetical protein